MAEIRTDVTDIIDKRDGEEEDENEGKFIQFLGLWMDGYGKWQGRDTQRPSHEGLRSLEVGNVQREGRTRMGIHTDMVGKGRHLSSENGWR